MEEQIKFCFDIYDLNDDGFISKEEMMTMMKTCMVKTGRGEEEGDEGVKVMLSLLLSTITDNPLKGFDRYDSEENGS